MNQFAFYNNKPMIYYDSNLRESWKKIELQEKWYTEYPMLFTEGDLKLAKSQFHNHFYEWLGTIQIFNDMGYFCLIEKYQFRKYVDQREVFKNLVPEAVFNLITSRDFGGRQVPDLLAYSPDKSDWFFCEVKGGNDRVSDGQGKAFEKLANVSGKKIQLMKFKAQI